MSTAILIVLAYCLLGYLWHRVEKARHPELFMDEIEGDDPSEDPQSNVDWLFVLIWPLCLWFQFWDWARGLWKRI